MKVFYAFYLIISELCFNAFKVKLMASIAELRKDKKRFYSKNNLREVANTCNLLGTLLQEVGEHDLALKEHQEEASIFETLDDLIGVAIAHRRMGEVSFVLF